MKLNNFFWTNSSLKRNELTEKYEPVQPFLFLSLINRLNCEVVFDIGANVGFYSLLSSLTATVKAVHAFEAIEEPCREMIKNVEMNNLGSIININNLAVSNKNEEISFLVNKDPLSGINASKGSTFHTENKYSSQRTVKAVAIDNFYNVKSQGVGFKIDVEGHELSVIDGCLETLKNNTCFLQVECFSKNREGLFSKLDSLGYFCIYELHNDFYFTNENSLRDCESVSSLISESLNLLIKSSLGKFPSKPGRESQLTGVCKMLDGNKIEANLSADQNVFLNAEYAFYLMIDRKKNDVVWYSDNDNVQFSIPDGVDLKRVSVRGFVRDKRLPDKKISVDIKPRMEWE